MVVQNTKRRYMLRVMTAKIEFSDSLRGVPFARRVLRPAVRFYWNVLRPFTPVFFPLAGKKKRLAVCSVPVPRGRNRHL